MDATANPHFTPSAAAAARSERQYRRAMRHSRRVRRLKVGLPAAAVLLVAGFFAASWLGTALPEGVAVESTAIEGGKIVMRNPVMTGQNAQAQPYRLKALKAIQDIRTPDVIALETISADLPVSADVTARLEAESGVYDRAAQKMELDAPFEVETSAGMTAKLQSAIIEMGEGSVVTDAPVSVRTAEASVVANSMQILDKGRTIVFEDTVRMTIDPGALRQAGTNDEAAAD